MISFIIPAHNEAFEIGRALQSIFESARSVGKPFEVIVVNDASTDPTAALAQQAGARTLDVNLRKISAVRNAGARAAQGDLFFFVDADTQISKAVLNAALKALEEGAVGGGATVTFAEPVGLATKFGIDLFSFFYMHVLNWAAGCFVYATRSAFEAVKGFDETLYASEEVALSIALKRRGRFVVLPESVTTSARKLRMYSPLRILPLAGSFLIHGRNALRRREGLEWWYEGKREKR